MLTVGVPSLQPAMCNFSSHLAANTDEFAGKRTAPTETWKLRPQGLQLAGLSGLVLGGLCKEPHFARRDHIHEIVESVSSPIRGGQLHRRRRRRPRIAIPSAHSTSSPPRPRPLLKSSPQRTNEPTTIAYGAALEVPCGQRLSNRRPRQSLEAPSSKRFSPLPVTVLARRPQALTLAQHAAGRQGASAGLCSPPCHHVTPWGPDARRAHQLQLVLFPSEPLRAQEWLQLPATLGVPPFI